MELAELKYPIQWNQSMNTVLVQELLRYNKLNKIIKVSLKNTMDGMKGIIVLSE
jgi:dynein heavy chain